MHLRTLQFAICKSVLFLLLAVPAASAQERFDKVVDKVNERMVKLYGLGGFRGLPPYGTALIISPEGHLLTVSSYLIESPKDLRIHLADGRRFDKITVLANEPELDAAILKIEGLNEKLPYFDLLAASQQPMAQPGTSVLAFSNQFKIAERNEPMSIQRGTVSAITRLRARRGINEAPYNGAVYVIDAITNNPGAGGGALTTRKGELLGIIGKELRNNLTDTWINYAMPLSAKVELPDPEKPDQKRVVALTDFIAKGMKGEWKTVVRKTIEGGKGGYHGIVMVTDPEGVFRTPPYIEEVRTNSPAAKVGLKPDDLIVYVNGELCTSVKTFKEIMSKTQPKEKITMDVRRGDKLKTVEVVLDEQPKFAVAPK
jgi:serine protease Do